MEREFKSIDGKLSYSMKELPNWYGIQDIGFIWHGEWSDPEIEYKGRRINCYIVEDTMWERFRDDYEGNGKNADDYIEEFAEYMNKYADDVYELIEIATEITGAK